MKCKVLFSLFILTAVLAIAQNTQSENFRQEGIASWYGAEFAGRPTASGEIFDPRLLTAAHPKLPFGTIVRVTNTQNNKQVTVKVNDRGPYKGARIIDLSQAAAEKLDMVSTGTAPVRVEAVSAAANPARTIELPTTGSPSFSAGPALPVPVREASPALTPFPAVPANSAPVSPSPAAPVSSPPAAFPRETLPPAAPALAATGSAPGGTALIIPGLPPAGTGKVYRLQVGSYRIQENAVISFEKLKRAGLYPAYEIAGDLTRVVLPEIRPDAIQSLAAALGSAGFGEVLVREEN